MRRWMMRMAAVLALVLVSCDSDPTESGGTIVDRVEVGAADVALSLGDTAVVVAVPRDEDGGAVSTAIQWRSRNAAVATVRGTGSSVVIEAKGAGTARIEAEAGGKVGAVDITVTAAPQVVELRIQPGTLVVAIGQALPIEAQALAADGSVIPGVAVQWSSGSAAIAAVNPDVTPGTAAVHGLAAGTAIVTASIGGVSAQAVVQVVSIQPPPANVASVTIAPSTISLVPGQEVTLQAIAKAADGSIIGGRNVVWSVTSGTIAAVAPLGGPPFARLSALSSGTATVIATVDGVSGNAQVQVNSTTPPPQQVQFLMFGTTKRSTYVNGSVMMSEFLRAQGPNGPISNPVVTWSVQDSSIASIDANGIARGLRKGITRVHARAGSVSASTDLVVFDPDAGNGLYGMTFDWWDNQFHLPPQIGTQAWTDANGQVHQVALYPAGGTLVIRPDGTYERVLRIEGWVTINLQGRKVIDRQETDRGIAGIIVGGETGYWLKSNTTPGYEYTVVAGRDAGHIIMRAALGTAAVQPYLFRMLQ